METWGGIHFRIYFLAWSALLCFDSCQSLTNKEATDSSSPELKAVSSCNKFLTQSYYDKHENIIDSEFHSLIAREFSCDCCQPLQLNHNFEIKLSALHRSLVGEGSHRHLSTSIKFKINPLESTAEKPEISLKTCNLVILERLSSGVFADPFELQHLKHRAYSNIAVFGDTNLELPSFLCNRSVVEIHLDLSSNSLQGPINISVELPLHARYQPLNESGYSAVEFGAPDIFMRCNLKEFCSPSCLFQLTTDSPESSGSNVVWRLPCGVKDHATLVSAITFASALLSTLSIILASLFYSAANFLKFSNNLEHLKVYSVVSFW